MVQARQTTPSEVPLPNQSALVDAQTDAYVKVQKKADFARNLSQYMFWGATTILAGIVGAFVMGSGVLAPALVPWVIAGGVTSLTTFLGSLMFSHRATSLSERANVLYSDIDSQHQAKRMVQAFAKAQSTQVSASDVPFTRRDGKSWVQSVGGQMQRADNWADRVVAQSAVEDAQTMRDLRSRR